MRKLLAALTCMLLCAGEAFAYDPDPARVEVRLDAELARQIPPRERARLLMERGLAREAQRRPLEALEDFSAALDSHALPRADIARARFNRGVVLEELGRTEDAIRDYTVALNLERRFAAALNNRGNAYRRLGRLSEASADYKASLEAGNPQPEFPLYGMGQIEEALGRKEQARDFYEQALASNPDYAPAAQRLALFNAPVLQPIPQRESPAPARRTVTFPAEPQARPAPVSGALIQLGSFRQEKNASVEWERVRRLMGSGLAGVSPRIVAADIPGRGRFYRLRAGPVADAASLCAEIARHGFYCLPLPRNSAP